MMSVLHLYGIDGITHTLFPAPDAIISVRGLRGEELEKKLAEIFEDKKKTRKQKWNHV